jgi:hypothetical protein
VRNWWFETEGPTSFILLSQNLALCFIIIFFVSFFVLYFYSAVSKFLLFVIFKFLNVVTVNNAILIPSFIILRIIPCLSFCVLLPVYRSAYYSLFIVMRITPCFFHFKLPFLCFHIYPPPLSSTKCLSLFLCAKYPLYLKFRTFLSNLWFYMNSVFKIGSTVTKQLLLYIHALLHCFKISCSFQMQCRQL